MNCVVRRARHSLPCEIRNRFPPRDLGVGWGVRTIIALVMLWWILYISISSECFTATVLQPEKEN